MSLNVDSLVGDRKVDTFGFMPNPCGRYIRASSGIDYHFGQSSLSGDFVHRSGFWSDSRPGAFIAVGLALRPPPLQWNLALHVSTLFGVLLRLKGYPGLDRQHLFLVFVRLPGMDG